MTPLTMDSIAADAPLSESLHVRLTAAQGLLLREVSRVYRRSVGAVLRDILICWAGDTLNDWSGDDAPVDLHALVADLQRLSQDERVL